ncbi:hypothetical protein MHC_03165 [Mycoplasma haemocanis str. Illinois]|uniref:Uncharacterized protein n=1 Tax=Mycoplasma haemocanis (strain Illinois) TaxID=1111676 RepID=H6N771_MYCHN|nr:hypothetical protein [Mycoplasma haemocanis]AEW45493.1 hypothetical protein MHC_03165 [Mycoplasma haemocanis str. Illinois]
MNGSLALKGALGIGGIGTIATGGYLINKNYGSGQKTLRTLLKDVSLINDKNSHHWKAIFEEHKRDQDFINELKLKKSDLSSNSKNDEAAPIISAWCKEKLNLPTSVQKREQILDQIKKWCVTQPNTIREKLDSLGKSVISDWKAKYDTIKNNDLYQEIKTLADTFNNESDKEKGGPALNKWCSDNLAKNTWEDGASGIFEKAKIRCVGN